MLKTIANETELINIINEKINEQLAYNNQSKEESDLSYFLEFILSDIQSEYENANQLYQTLDFNVDIQNGIHYSINFDNWLRKHNIY